MDLKRLKLSVILVKMTDITPQPTSIPNTLELQESPKSNSNYFIVVVILVIIHIYLIYKTDDIIYRGLLLICLISMVWIFNKKNTIANVVDDDGVNLIEG